MPRLPSYLWIGNHPPTCNLGNSNDVCYILETVVGRWKVSDCWREQVNRTCISWRYLKYVFYLNFKSNGRSCMRTHTHSHLPATPKILLKAQKHCTIAPISSGSIWPCAVMLPLPKAKNPAVSAQNVLTRTPWGAPTHSQRLENWNNSGSLVPF